MSKIGKQLIKIPEGVEIKLEGSEVIISGPKGKNKHNLPKAVSLEQKEGNLEVLSKDKSKQGRANFGTTRALLANMVLGVTNGWNKQLELVGTGYRSETDGKSLTLTVGFSHPVKIDEVKGISYKIEKNVIAIEGIDKQLVGHMAAKIRAVRPPEPYKGKGIKYVDEVIRRKAGKAAKTAGTA